MTRLPVKKTYKLFIGGEFPRSESGRTYEAQGANVARASRKDVRDAVRAARDAFPKWAGLTAYNHNLDSSREFYSRIISTRTYADRLATLSHVRNAGISVCCGGIVGMGETEDDRIALLPAFGVVPTGAFRRPGFRVVVILSIRGRGHVRL